MGALARFVGIAVRIKLAFQQQVDMGVALADEAARWLADAGDGLIQGYESDWWDVEPGPGAWVRVLPAAA